MELANEPIESSSDRVEDIKRIGPLSFWITFIVGGSALLIRRVWGGTSAGECSDIGQY
jgi:hypothetical protein